MKRHMATLVLFIGALTSQTVIADTWVPGNPKPSSPVPDTWFADLTGLFSDLWGFLMF
jgi:hypothetical protein